MSLETSPTATQEILYTRRRNMVNSCENEVVRLQNIVNSIIHAESGIHNFENRLKEVEGQLSKRSQELNQQINPDTKWETYPELYSENWPHLYTSAMRKAIRKAEAIRYDPDKIAKWRDIRSTLPNFFYAYLLDKGLEHPILLVGDEGHEDLHLKAHTVLGNQIIQEISGYALLSKKDKLLQINTFERLAPEWTFQERGSGSGHAILPIETYQLTSNGNLAKIGEIPFEILGRNCNRVLRILSK